MMERKGVQKKYATSVDLGKKEDGQQICLTIPVDLYLWYRTVSVLEVKNMRDFMVDALSLYRKVRGEYKIVHVPEEDI